MTPILLFMYGSTKDHMCLASKANFSQVEPLKAIEQLMHIITIEFHLKVVLRLKIFYKCVFESLIIFNDSNNKLTIIK
jgi:hypothetical protein